MVFLIDLPRVEDPEKRSTNTLTSFGEELSLFLKAQGVDENMIHSLQNYDFSETSRYGFIHTMAGSHPDPNVWQRTGYCGLGRTIKGLGLDTAGILELDYVCSSIGSLNQDLLIALYNACQGDPGTKEYEARTGKPRKTKGGSSVEDPAVLSRIRVYYPSRETVIRSRGGPNVSCFSCSPECQTTFADIRPSLLARFASSQSGGIRARFHAKSSETARMYVQVY